MKKFLKHTVLTTDKSAMKVDRWPILEYDTST